VVRRLLEAHSVRNLNAGPFQPMIGSFDLHLRAEHKSPKTITVYTDAATWFASAFLVPAGLTDWSQVTARHVQEWVSTLLAGYEACWSAVRA
jgi:hypothetical protein